MAGTIFVDAEEDEKLEKKERISKEASRKAQQRDLIFMIGGLILVLGTGFGLFLTPNKVWYDFFKKKWPSILSD